VGVGADLLALGLAGGTQLVGHALALGLHAAVDRLGDRLHVVDARHAHVDDVHAPAAAALDHGQHLALDVVHHVVAAGGEQFAHGALVGVLLDGVAHHAVGLHGAGVLVQGDVADVGGRVHDAPAHVRVDHHGLLLRREHG